MAKLTWQQFISIPNGTRIYNHGADECVAVANLYHEDVLGGAFVPVQSARQWWEMSWSEINRLYTKSLYPQAGALFVALGGIYDRTYGHIGGVVSEAYTDGSFDSMEQNAGSGAARYLWRYRRKNDNSLFGFLIPRNNPAKKNQPLEPYQRRTHSLPVVKRKNPTTKSADLRDNIPGNTVGDFDGWIYGETVNGINIWFRGMHSGAWCWAGGFTSQSTFGLKNLNPTTPAPSVKPEQRKADPIPVNVREKASSASKKTGQIDANAVITPEGWVRGQSVEGIDIWYKVAGGYAWAGGFTVETTASLKDLNQEDPEPVDPPESTDPTGPVDDDLGFPGDVLKTIDRWSESAPDWGKEWDRPMPATVNLKFPDHIVERTVRPNGGFYVGREGKPNHLAVHHAVTTSLDSAVNSLMGQNNNSANAVFCDNEIVNMVDTRDTPSTNGRFRSNQFSCTGELINSGSNTGKPSAETHETAAWWYAREVLRWGMKTPVARLETVFGHNELSKSPTACPGDVDVAWISNRINEIINAALNEEEPPAPDYSGLEEAIRENNSLLKSLIDLLKKIFRIGE